MGELSFGCWNITSKYIVLHKHLVSRTLILSFLILSSFLKLIYYALYLILFVFLYLCAFLFLSTFLSFFLSLFLPRKSVVSRLQFSSLKQHVYIHSTVYLVVVGPPGPTMVIFYPYKELHTLPAWFCIYHRVFHNPPPPL